MERTRRAFLQGSLGSLGLGASCMSAAATENEDTTECLDYGLSFICNTAAFNAVRFWVESRTILIDEQKASQQVFYQCGSCKSENTFAEKDLFIKRNYDFLPILGGQDWLIFRRPNQISETYRSVQSSVWGKPILKLRRPGRANELKSFAAIRDATAEGLPIVARTEIANEETRLRAVIEYPVKTMNIEAERSIYQVDTGPIALPDLTKRYDQPIECLKLAFVAFNAPHFADFVVEQPTAVVHDGLERPETYHYSNPFSLPAQNRLLAIPLPEQVNNG